MPLKYEPLKTTKNCLMLFQMKLRTVGKIYAANVVKNVTLGSPTKGERYRKSIELIHENILSLSSTLLLLIKLKLSKSKYQGLRAVSKQYNCKLYPP